MKKSKQTKSNDPVKILRMISRNEELERRDGKFQRLLICKNKRKYDRNNSKRELGNMKELDSHFYCYAEHLFTILICLSKDARFSLVSQSFRVYLQ